MHLRDSVAAIAAFHLCFLATAHAQHEKELGRITNVPRLIRFSGSYHAAGQQPPAGVVGATFSIYREHDGGTPLWNEVQNIELDKDANYTVLLGSTTNEGVPAELFAAGEPRWLQVQLELPGFMPQPRTPLGSVPYALKASDADTLGGLPASAYLRAESAGPAGTASGTAQSGGSGTAAYLRPRSSNGTPGYLGMFTNSTDLGNSAIYQSGNLIGINTTPTRPLDILGTGNELFSIKTTNGTTPYGIVWDQNNNYGLVGVSNGNGMFQHATGRQFQIQVQGGGLGHWLRGRQALGRRRLWLRWR